MRIGDKKLQHAAHCDAHASNTRFPAALCGLKSDAIEGASLRHASSVPKRQLLAAAGIALIGVAGNECGILVSIGAPRNGHKLATYDVREEDPWASVRSRNAVVYRENGRTMTISGEMLTDGFEIYVSSIVTWDNSRGELITDADRQRILRNVRSSLESQGARVVLN